MDDLLRVSANGVDFACLEAGPADGPLALCLHGFPDTAHTFDGLLGRLAGRGWHAVAPFMRGYHPTSPAPDGAYQPGALALDAVALVEALAGGRPAALVGHDWGGVAVCAAAVLRPDLVRALVSMALPHPAVFGAHLAGDWEQLKRSWYFLYFQLPAFPEGLLTAEGGAAIRRLWREWSPGLDLDRPEVAAHLGGVVATLLRDGVLEAALGYYRQALDPTRQRDQLRAAEMAAFGRIAPPALFLAGRDDGCIGSGMAQESAALCDGECRVEVLDGCGHFLHLERPGEVLGLVAEFLGTA